MAGAFKGVVWPKRLRYVFYASSIGGIINVANQYIKTGELDIGAFVTGYIGMMKQNTEIIKSKGGTWKLILLFNISIMK